MNIGMKSKERKKEFTIQHFFSLFYSLKLDTNYFESDIEMHDCGES